MISETEHTGCANNDNALGIVKEEPPSAAQRSSVHPALSCRHQDVYTKLVVTCVHPDIAMSVCVGITTYIDHTQTIKGMPQQMSMFKVSFEVNQPETQTNFQTRPSQRCYTPPSHIVLKRHSKSPRPRTKDGSGDFRNQFRSRCDPETPPTKAAGGLSGPPTSSAEMAEVEACAMKHTAKNTSGPEIWMVVY